MTITPASPNSTGDLALDLIASVAELAFEDAERNRLARSELLGIFDRETLYDLYLKKLISWNPYQVVELPSQLALMEVSL